MAIHKCYLSLIRALILEGLKPSHMLIQYSKQAQAHLVFNAKDLDQLLIKLLLSSVIDPRAIFSWLSYLFFKDFTLFDFF